MNNVKKIMKAITAPPGEKILCTSPVQHLDPAPGFRAMNTLAPLETLALRGGESPIAEVSGGKHIQAALSLLTAL